MTEQYFIGAAIAVGGMLLGSALTLLVIWLLLRPVKEPT